MIIGSAVIIIDEGETNVGKRIYKIENPVYLKKDEIDKKYWDKQVLMTNIKMVPDFSSMDGGIVRYYAIDAKDELYKKLADLRKKEGVDAIDCCGIEYIGPIYLNLWAAGGGNF